MGTTLGAQIKQARTRAHLSQSQLAMVIGAHVTSISDWERGRNAPSARHLIGIARATGTTIDDFSTDEDEEAELAADLARVVRALVRAELGKANQ